MANVHTIASGTIMDKSGRVVLSRKAGNKLALVGGYFPFRCGAVLGVCLKFMHYMGAVAQNPFGLEIISDYKNTIRSSTGPYEIDIEMTKINGIYQGEYHGRWFTNINLAGVLKSDPDKLPPGLLVMPREEFLSKQKDDVRTLDTILAVIDSFSENSYDSSVTDLLRIHTSIFPEDKRSRPNGETPLIYPQSREDDCSPPLYHHEKTVTGAVVANEFGEYLLVRCMRGNRGDPESKNTLSLPGGHAEYQQTIRNDCTREIYEETGNKVHLLGYLGVYITEYREDHFATNFAPYAQVRKEDISTEVPGDRREEISEILWKPYEWVVENMDQLRTCDTVLAIADAEKYRKGEAGLIPEGMIKQCSFLDGSFW